MALIYKVMSREEWRLAQAAGMFAGSAVDVRDGFIHLSARDQLAETIARHFAGQTDLMLLAIEERALVDALKWEPSRGGALFPHLFRPLKVAEATWARPFDAADVASVQVWLDEAP